MRVVREQESCFPAVLKAVWLDAPPYIGKSASSLLVSKASVRLSPSPWKYRVLDNHPFPQPGESGLKSHYYLQASVPAKCHLST